MKSLLEFITIIFLASPTYAETIIEQAQKVEAELDSINDEGMRLIRKFDEEVLPLLDKRQAELDKKHEKWMKEHKHERRNQN